MALLLAAGCGLNSTGNTAIVEPPPATAIGSLRNATVAYRMKEGPREQLLFLAPSMTAEKEKSLAKLAPNVRVMTGLDRQRALQLAPEAHGVDARLISPEFLEKAGRLVWVHSPSAGVDRFVRMERLVNEDRIILTNSRAVHGPAIADHVFAMLLSLSRNLRFYDGAQREGRWAEADPPVPSSSLSGKTMLVVGLGGIGEEVAKRADGFGMRVTAIRRSDAAAPPFVAKVGKQADLGSMLPEADVVVLCVPLTGETERMIDAKAFGAMKKGAILVNIARGRVVDSGAMAAALESGQLGGACLDVTDPEPLPAGDPLWKRSNVIITPHVAADAAITGERGWELFSENMRRFGAGEPLLNVVDKKAGY